MQNSRNRIFNSAYVVLLILSISCSHKDKLDYKNPNLPIEERIDDLLSRMTVEEKARQLDMYIPIDLVTNHEFDEVKMDSVIGEVGIGSFHDLYPLHAQLPNEIQQYLVEKTRLGIPALLTAEALHGYSGSKGTCFPAPIGMGSMWDTTLMRKIGNIIGIEARSHGIHFVLSPILGLAREPRWGRVEETYGEDPYLVAQTGKYIILGMQGKNLDGNNSVISEPK